ncbi:Hpt domain-containing protein [Aquimonas sp.]|jgi:chemosensory pili system protein ChpA (sensor histidine kinase/response regulator)|uniref:Hpt domain-containing protein n=1 Tax=Aquimonas sp. TaxID=1872588 RepID=UPI0037BE9204
MRLQDDIDFTTLTWVKGELDETLKQARLALEAFVEDPDDASQMRFCATYLHQVQGTLRMVELYGAAMVTEEMEQLAIALQNRQVAALDEAYAVLMRGIVQLPDYLERLQTGLKDIPIVLLPLLNDLRGARGEKSLSESALFAPDLSQALPASVAGPIAPLPELELRQLAAVARSQFQIALLRWFKGVEPEINLARMIEVCDRLVSVVTQEEGRRLFWVGGSVLFGVRSGEIEASQQLKQTVGRVEREVKHLADAGENGFRVDPPRELTRNLLYFVAHGRSNSDRLAEVRSVFQLDMFVPTAEEFEDARRSISGHNRALIDTVAAAIREDLLRVKDALDLYLRKQDAQPGELSGQVDVLDRVGDTLGMLGLGVPRRVVMEQRDVVALVVQGQRAADESTLLDIAGALLYVEATLDDQVQQIGASAQPSSSGTETLPRAEARRVLEAVVKEAQSNFAQAKQCFVAFVESNWDHAQLQDVQRLLDEVSGAMRILDITPAAELLQGVAQFTAVELVQHRRVPNGEQMDTLADALASLEYFIEALREQRSDRSKILDVARERLVALGYWPIPEHALASVDSDIPTAPAAEPVASLSIEEPLISASSDAETVVLDAEIPQPRVVDDLASLGAVEIAPGADVSDLIVGEAATEALQPPREVHELAGFKPTETVATRPPAPEPVKSGAELSGFQIGAEDIDEEIREVFVEEVQEEIDNLRQLLPIWRTKPDDVESMKPIRRVFHTLKGSGRLVGALVLGEFAWKVENMLNRVLDHTIPARPEVIALVEHARDVLPQLLAALRGEAGHYADLQGIQAVADALAAGQVVAYTPPTAQAAAELQLSEPDLALPMEVIETVEVAESVSTPEIEETEVEDITLSDAQSSALAAMLAAHAVPAVEPEPTAPALEPLGFEPGESDPAGIELADLDAANSEQDRAVRPATEAPSSDEDVFAAEFGEWQLEELSSSAIDTASQNAAESTATATSDNSFELEPIELTEANFGDGAIGLEHESTEQTDLVLIEPDLFEILKAEVAGHLDTVEAYLQRGADQPLPVQESLLRAVHTINGAFAMTEVDVGTEIAWPLEGYIKRLLAMSEAPSMQGFDVIDEAAQAMRSLMIELDQPMPRPARHAQLAARISALRDELPEPTAPVLSSEREDAHSEVLAAVSADSFALALDTASVLSPAESAVEPLQAKDEAPVMDAELAGMSDSGELSFASEFISGEPFDPEARAQSADIEIIETEPGSPSPYWSDTEGTSLSPAVDSGLTLDEIGEAESADAWLAAFEAEVAGESKLDTRPQLDAPATPAAADTLAEETFIATDFEDPALAMDAQLIESLSYSEPALESPPLEIESPVSSEAPVEVADLDIEARSPAAIAFEPIDNAKNEAPQDSTGAEALEFDEVELENSASLEVADFGELAEALGELNQQPVSELQTPSAVAPAVESLDVLEFDELDTSTLAEAMASFVVAEPAVEASESADHAETGTEASVETEELPATALTEASDSAAAEVQDLAASDAEQELSISAAEAEAFEAELVELNERTEPAEPAVEAMLSAAAVALDFAPVEAPDTSAPSGKVRLAIAADPEPDGPLDVTDVDVDLLDVFLEEGVDILDHSDSLLQRLRETAGDPESVVGLQRDLHTLKGGARMAGLLPIGDLAHAIESLLETVAAGGRDLGEAGMEVLERSFDRLHGMVSRVGERRAIAMPENLLACVEALLRGEQLPLVESLDEAAPEAVKVAAVPTEAEAVPARTVPAPIRFIPTETALDEEENVVRAPQEQIRIRADLLDRLVNYAGEVAIYRARLEQQLGAFRGNLGELDQTTTRLRDQLRKLEIETEAQILSRYQRQQDEGDTQFDPLELDRFSTLQQLSRALSESASDIVNLQTTLEDLTRQYETLLLQQSRVSSDLQEGLMRTRMVPFDSLVPRLRRILRQTAGELGKQAQLKVEGAQGEMDRNVLDRMTAPLEHMLRNALAHGLETPEQRIAAGKPAEGTIRVVVAREASEVLIRVIDDGRGLDREAIRRKAIERGLMKADAQLGDRDLYGFILESGFSTAATVSKISGRGVGMDVVYSEIRQLGGSLHIESERGRGSEFIIRLPFTLAVTQAVFVKQGETSFAVPITSVQGVSRIDRADLEAQLASGAPSFSYAGEDYVIHDLGLLLGHPAARAADSLQVPLLLARSGDQRAAICVDAVLGSREIVVKPTGPQVSSIPGIFGATIMGDGRVVVILDVAPLVRRAAAIEPIAPAPSLADQRVVPLVMVVDDSITMRKVTGRVLERHNFEVLTAKDGVDAIEKLAERIPDVMLLDIEMPRMDGYELATHMRNDPRLKSVPIIMITSRTGEKHRQRAFEIGVDRYLGKPYQEADLMRNVQEILQDRRERSR